MGSILNERLLSSYQFDDTVELDDVRFDVRLEIIKPLKFIESLPLFYEKNNVLESYRIESFNSLLKEYQAQVEKNNKRRILMLELYTKENSINCLFLRIRFDQ